MGSCVSRSSAAKPEKLARAATAMVVDSEGGAATQLAVPVTAHEALGDDRRRASSFVCSADELYFDAPILPMAAHGVLQAGQLYFVLPLSMLRQPLSGQEMAALAVKASAALEAAAVEAGMNGSAARAATSRGKQRRGQTMARVAPLVVVSNEEGEPAAYAEWNYHVYGGRQRTQKTLHPADRTVGKTTNGVGQRSGTARHRTSIQSLSAIIE